MSGLFSLGFGAPLALLAVVALPAIWWLVRRTPPAPTTVDFPPTALMRDLVSHDDTPAESPWWLLLLRLGLAALLIAALAEPWWHPEATGDDHDGPLWLVVDNGWAAAEGWPEIRDEAARRIDRAESRGRPVVVATTADGADQPLVPTDAATARTRLAATSPRPWADDRTGLVSALEALAAKSRPGDLVWLAHGADLGPRDEIDTFATALVRLAGSAPVTLSRPARLDLLAIDALDNRADALVAGLLRAEAAGPADGRLRALDAKGRALADIPFAFAPGETRVQAAITLPTELRNDITRLDIADHTTAGAVRLVDDRGRRRAVGLVAGTGFERDRPLLAPTHYLEAALAPFTDVRRAKSTETAGAVDELIAGGISVLIAADIGAFPPAVADRLKAWVEKGGTLVRFAGPHLAAPRNGSGDGRDFTTGPRGADPLLPVVPRAETRAFGGALSWETPRGLGPFAETGPFAGMAVPGDVHVLRQILAEPGPGLTERTWASLDDGTPLVTAAPLGRGRLVFFHVGADTAWSNLPLDQTFVEMLRRITALSASVPTTATAATVGGRAATLPPWRLLDGFGRLGAAGADARPVPARDFDTLRPSRAHPPGLWGLEGAIVALPTLRPDDRVAALPPRLVDEVAARTTGAPRITVVTRGSEHPTALGPGLLLAALVLALADGIVALHPRHLIRRLVGRLVATALLVAALVAVAPPSPVDAAEPAPPGRTTDAAEAVAPPAAALAARLAHVVTGNATLDDIAQRGLVGLSHALAARTAFEPAEPVGVDPATDDLSPFPLIYWPIDPEAPPPSPQAMSRIDAFMKNGGTVLFDTRDADEAVPGRLTPAALALRRLLDGLDLPALEPVPADHVLGRTFYLLRTFPGRTDAGRLWVEATPDGGKTDPAERMARSGDGVSPILVTGNDFAGAWGLTDDGGDLLPMIATAPEAREMALRVGINIAMYVLTGNYKADQVHIPLILQRLGR